MNLSIVLNSNNSNNSTTSHPISPSSRTPEILESPRATTTNSTTTGGDEQPLQQQKNNNDGNNTSSSDHQQQNNNNTTTGESSSSKSNKTTTRRPAPIDIVPRPLPHSSPDDLRDAVRSNARVDRPYDVALEYNRLMLFRYALVTAVLAIPLMYFTPIIGILMAPPGFLLGYWTQQKARFQHGGDVRACVNRDCSMAVGIVFMTIALLLDGFNVIDLIVGGDSSSSKLPSVYSSTPSTTGKKTTTTTTKQPLSGLGSSTPIVTTTSSEPTPTPAPSPTPEIYDTLTHPPPPTYSHTDEEAAHSPLLRKIEIVLGALIFFPGCLTLRHLFRIRKLVNNPISAHIGYNTGDEGGDGSNGNNNNRHEDDDEGNVVVPSSDSIPNRNQVVMEEGEVDW